MRQKKAELKGRNRQFNNVQYQQIHIQREQISGYKDWSGRKWGVTDGVYGTSLQGDENALKLDSGDSCYNSKYTKNTELHILKE